MGNTLLYHNAATGMYSAYRPWDDGRGGSLTLQASSIDSLGAGMRNAQGVFFKPFEPKAGIPDIDFGNVNKVNLRPLDEDNVKKVIEALKQ